MACQHGSAPNWVQWGGGHNLYNVRSSIGTGSLLWQQSVISAKIHQIRFRLKGKREGRGEERGQRWKGKFRGLGGEGKRVGKRGEEGKFRGPGPPNVFFLEPRLALPC